MRNNFLEKREHRAAGAIGEEIRQSAGKVSCPICTFSEGIFLAPCGSIKKFSLLLLPVIKTDIIIEIRPNNSNLIVHSTCSVRSHPVTTLRHFVTPLFPFLSAISVFRVFSSLTFPSPPIGAGYPNIFTRHATKQLRPPFKRLLPFLLRTHYQPRVRLRM